MLKSLTFLAIATATATMMSCAHTGAGDTARLAPVANSAAQSSSALFTGSRLPRRGSPLSYGVEVIQLQRLLQTGEVEWPSALRKLSVKVN